MPFNGVGPEYALPKGGWREMGQTWQQDSTLSRPSLQKKPGRRNRHLYTTMTTSRSLATAAEDGRHANSGSSDAAGGDPLESSGFMEANYKSYTRPAAFRGP